LYSILVRIHISQAAMMMTFNDLEFEVVNPNPNPKAYIALYCYIS